VTALSERALERRLKRHVRGQLQTFFAVCAPGFESVLETEVRALAATSEADITVGETARGGVHFTGHLDSMYYAHLHLYSATRLLWRVGSFLARSLPMLFDKARKIPWEHYLAVADAYTIRVSAKTSRLNHQRAVAGSLSQAISRALNPHGLAPQYVDKIDPERTETTLELHVRLFQDTCTLSINTSGDHLYKRGYRSLPHPAPLRETLASSLLQDLQVATYDTLLDPMCGSGTLPIEAALLCSHLPPGYLPAGYLLPGHDTGTPRHYAFERLPTFQASKWQRLRQEAVAASEPCALRIVAGDNHADAVAMTEKHARAAGVGEMIEVVKRDAREWLQKDVMQLEGRTLIFGNAPYGKRLQEADEVTTLQSLQQHLQSVRAAGRDVTLAVITSPQTAQKLTGFTTHKRFRNGGLTVVLLVA
jgi:putative N6-adenine-specific DNA methylase